MAAGYTLRRGTESAELNAPLFLRHSPEETVQLSTFGRLLQGKGTSFLVSSRRVSIEDPVVLATSGRTHHANVTFNGRHDSRVSGTVFEITDAELMPRPVRAARRVHTCSRNPCFGEKGLVYVDARSATGAL